jgi:DNA-binding response OmpR family regulator
MRTRVLIVDDDPRVRALARALLQAAGYAVAAEAADGAQALAAVRRVRPDAAIVDVQLPDTDGLALARTLVDSDSGLRIVLTSTDPTLVSVAALAESPAVAFVPKDELAITDLAPWLCG